MVQKTRLKTAVRFKENVKVCMEVASLPEPAPEPCCFCPVKQPGKAGAEAASGGLKKPKKRISDDYFDDFDDYFDH